MRNYVISTLGDLLKNVVHLGSLASLANHRPIDERFHASFSHLHRFHVGRVDFALVRHATVHQSGRAIRRDPRAKATSEERVGRSRRVRRQQATIGRSIERSLAKRRGEFREAREEVERRVGRENDRR